MVQRNERSRSLERPTMGGDRRDAYPMDAEKVVSPLGTRNAASIKKG
jgi:hypothetical protein